MLGNMRDVTVQPQEIQLIDTRRTSLVPADLCRHRYIKIKREQRDRTVAGLARIAAASLALNVVLSVLVYILRAGI